MKEENDSVVQKLKHMLGANDSHLKKEWGFRDHYCASIGSPDDLELQKMLKDGLVSKGGKSNRMIYYHATLKGAKKIGFKDYQLRNMKKM